MNARSGYSLFEVLVAFAITTMVIAVLIPGQATLLSRANAGQEELLAYDFALSRLTEQALGAPIEELSIQSSYDNWLVATSIVSVTDLAISNAQFRIEVLVSAKGGNELARAEMLVVAR